MSRHPWITGTGLSTLPIYRAFFARALADVRAAAAAYLAEVEDWYTNGDGAAPDWQTEHDEEGNARQWNAGGHGYQFPYCPHGMSLWTDYDNICGGCEESLTAIAEAQGIARERFIRFNARWNWINAAPVDLDADTRRELTTWAMSLWPQPVVTAS